MNVALRQPILFLDYDGVLHPGMSGTFTRMPLLVEWLRRYPEVAVVVSSDWRLHGIFQYLLGPFPADLRARVAGTTPDLREKADAGEFLFLRQREVEACRQRAGHWGPFAVIDDTPALFQPGYDKLVATDPNTGLTRENLAQVNVKLMQQGYVTEAHRSQQLRQA